MRSRGLSLWVSLSSNGAYKCLRPTGNSRRSSFQRLLGKRFRKKAPASTTSTTGRAMGSRTGPPRCANFCAFFLCTSKYGLNVMAKGRPQYLEVCTQEQHSFDTHGDRCHALYRTLLEPAYAFCLQVPEYQPIPIGVGPGETPFSQLAVGTTDTVRMSYIMNKLVRRSRFMMLVGTAGTGKTSIVKEYLRRCGDAGRCIRTRGRVWLRLKVILDNVRLIVIAQINRVFACTKTVYCLKTNIINGFCCVPMLQFGQRCRWAT